VSDESSEPRDLADAKRQRPTPAPVPRAPADVVLSIGADPDLGPGWDLVEYDWERGVGRFTYEREEDGRIQVVDLPQPIRKHRDVEYEYARDYYFDRLRFRLRQMMAQAKEAVAAAKAAAGGVTLGEGARIR
jgi:hypothetical protein